MKTIDLSSWSEFAPTIKSIMSDEDGRYRPCDFTLPGRILFRGQADAEWLLKTTLERFSNKPWSVQEYAYLASFCGPEVESYTGRELGLLDQEELIECCKSYDTLAKLPDYSFWIYLRHHGFPSPLLDWTASPYVAAFFAAAEQIQAERMAVIAYIERPVGAKVGIIGERAIAVQEPYLRSHPRHLLQQTWHTVCTERKNREYLFSCHEDVFARSSNFQDMRIKITLPRSERLGILFDLRRMNISHYSLFQTEDSLMRTLAFEKIEIRES